MGIEKDFRVKNGLIVGETASFGDAVTAPSFVGPLTGNASTATSLQTSRTINGTSFDGSGNITTANWGTARTLTIGGTGKSVNGSAAVSWSLAEIGVNNSTLTLATSGIATGDQTWSANQGTNATFTVNVPGTNLAMGGSSDARTITSSTGSNVSVPVANTTAAGFMSLGDKVKLDGIAAGAQVNTVTSVAGRTGAVTLAVADVSNAVPDTRSISTGDGLNGGGNFTSNRTFSVDSTVVRTTNLLNQVKTFGVGDARLTADFPSSTGATNYMPTPTDFNDKAVTPIFSTDWPGASWAGILTVKGWSSSNYAAWQLAGGSNTSAENEWYLRSGVGSSWNSYNRIWHSGNISPVPDSRSISTGDGLNGGGNFTTNRTFSVDSTVIRTSGNQTISGTLTTTLNHNSGYLTINSFSVGTYGAGSTRLWYNANADQLSFDNSTLVNVNLRGGDISSGTINDARIPSNIVRDSITISAGNGMTGGGTLASNRTITLGTPGTLTTSTSNSVSGSSHTHNIDATDAATANTIMSRNSSGDTWARLFRSNYAVTNSNIAGIYTTQTIGGDYMRPSTPAQVMNAVGAERTITSGSGLSGGGTLAADRTLSVDSTVIRTSGNQSMSGTKTFSGSIIVNGGSAAPDLLVNRTNSTINANMRFVTTSATDITIGQGDSAWFNVGSGDDIRYSQTGVFRVSASNGSIESKGGLTVSGRATFGSAVANAGAFLSTADLKLRTTSTARTGDVSVESTANSTATRNHMVFNNTGGECGSISTNGSTASFNTTSDYRRKIVHGSVIDPVDRVLALNPVHYNWVQNPDGLPEDGFLAHEVQTVIPNAVQGEKDAIDPETGNPEYQMMDHTKLIPLLTAALKETIQKNQQLEQLLNSALERITALEQQS